MNKMEAPPPIPPARALKERLPSVFARLGVDGRVKFIGAGADVLCGVDAAGAAGKMLASANLPAEIVETFLALQSAAQADQASHDATTATTTREIEFRLRLEGETRDLLATSFVEDAENLIIVIQDISRYVDALSQQGESLAREEYWRQHADATARARDQFLSVVSHELRSPLNGIQSWAHVLESQIDTDRPIVQRALAGIKTGVTQQVLLIEALLDATQILNGQFQLLQQPYSLNGAIQSAVDGLAAEAAQKQITVLFTPTVADTDMVGDAERIQQVFRHLLSNAIKFTDDHGDVQISVSRSADSAEIAVEDNGIGISPAFGLSIFEPFRQQDSSQTRRAAGLGLGLAVSRRVAELHGGSLKFESEGVGRGSTFRVVLPIVH